MFVFSSQRKKKPLKNKQRIKWIFFLLKGVENTLKINKEQTSQERGPTHGLGLWKEA